MIAATIGGHDVEVDGLGTLKLLQELHAKVIRLESELNNLIDHAKVIRLESELNNLIDHIDEMHAGIGGHMNGMNAALTERIVSLENRLHVEQPTNPMLREQAVKGGGD